MQNQGAYRMAATWLPRTNEFQDLSHCNRFRRAGAGLFTALSSLSWCEWVTLPVDFASLSSQKQTKQNPKYVLWNLCWWAPRGNEEKSQMHFSVTCEKQKELLFQILIKISVHMFSWRPSLVTSTHCHPISPSLAWFFFVVLVTVQSYPAHLFLSVCLPQEGTPAVKAGALPVLFTAVGTRTWGT